MYAPPPNGILDEFGRLFPEVAAARRRGVIFDFGNGVSGHFNWDMVERATKQGFWPDTSPPIGTACPAPPGVVDFPNVMSKFLMFGMPLAQVVACATLNAARVFPAFSDRGTLNIGAPGTWPSWNCGQAISSSSTISGASGRPQRLFPVATVLNGKRGAGRA